MIYKYIYKDQRPVLTLQVVDLESGKLKWQHTYPSFIVDVQSGDLITDLTLIEMGVMKSLNDTEGLSAFLKQQGVLELEDALLGNIMTRNPGTLNDAPDFFLLNKGGLVGDIYNNVTYYLELGGNDWSDNNKLYVKDLSEAKSEYNTIDSSDFNSKENRSDNYKTLYEKIDKYRFIGSLEEGESIEYFIDWLDNDDYWQLEEEGEQEVVESGSVEAINEKANKLLSEVQRYFGVWAGYAIINLDEDGKVQLKLRIKDHSGKWKNKGHEKYFLSIVISDKNPTAHFYKSGPEGLRRDEEEIFNSSTTVKEIIDFINEKIKEFQEDADIDGYEVEFKRGGVISETTNANAELVADRVASRMVEKHPATKNLSVERKAMIALALTDWLVSASENKYINDSSFRHSLQSMPTGGSNANNVLFVSMTSDAGRYLDVNAKKFEQGAGFSFQHGGNLPELINEGWKNTPPSKTVLIKDFGVKPLSTLSNSGKEGIIRKAGIASEKNKRPYIIDFSGIKTSIQEINKFVLQPDTSYYYVFSKDDNLNVKIFKLGDKFKTSDFHTGGNVDNIHWNLIEYTTQELFKYKGKKNADAVFKMVHKKFNNGNNPFLGGKVEFTVPQLEQAVYNDKVTTYLNKNGKVINENSIKFYVDYFNLDREVFFKYLTDRINASNENSFSDGGDVYSASSRFRPYELILFDPVIVGPNGNKLTCYHWGYEWTMLPNNEGELVSKRISDWTQAQISADTGRGIVHQFGVLRTDGVTETVSSESVPVLLGYADREKMKNFPSIVSSVKTLAKQRMQLAILEAQEKEYNKLYEQYSSSSLPEIKEIEEDSRFPGIIQDWKNGKFKVFAMEDVAYRQDNSYDYPSQSFKPNPHPDRTTKEQLTYMWINKRVSEDGGINPKGIYDLRQRVKRQERKVQEATGAKELKFIATQLAQTK